MIEFAKNYIILFIDLFYYNSNQLGTGQSRNTDTIRYGGISSDTKKSDPLLHDDPLEDFGVEVPVNPLPIQPKPKVKKSPKEPPIVPSVNPSYASTGHQRPRKPASAKRPLPQPQFQGQVQQSGRSPSPVYESLN